MSKQIVKRKGLLRLIYAFVNAFAGLAALWQREAAFRTEILFIPVLIFAGIFFSLELSDWISLAFAYLVLLMVECINSAIEQLADKIEPNYDQSIGKAKDMASAGVLMILVANCLLWIYLLIKYV